MVARPLISGGRSVMMLSVRRLAYRILLLTVALTSGVVALVDRPSLAATPTVNIQDRKGEYFPSSVTIHAGDSVKWVNHGLQPHTVTADSGVFDSGPIQSQKPYGPLQFPSVGTFPYHCTIPNHSASGTIVVVAAESSPTTAATNPPPPPSGGGGTRPIGGSTGTTAPPTTPGPTTVETVAPGVGTTGPTYPSGYTGPRLNPPRFAAPPLAAKHHGLPGFLRLLLTTAALLALVGLAWEMLRGRVAVPAFPVRAAPPPRSPWRSAAFGVDVPPWDDRDLP
ncbi:MAG: hypothetical protein QOG03_918 [Actinomycetota bacterium]|jgi:plastocyanin|nr:hypothetical protein [Actinomycetota bacterium]